MMNAKQIEEALYDIARASGNASQVQAMVGTLIAQLQSEQPTGDEYHAANRCVDAAVLHLTGSTEWPEGWMPLRDQFLGFIRAALLAHARLLAAAGGEAVAQGIHLKRETCGGKPIGHICPSEGDACRYPHCTHPTAPEAK
jgi:hypothetical protein